MDYHLRSHRSGVNALLALAGAVVPCLTTAAETTSASAPLPWDPDQPLTMRIDWGGGTRFSSTPPSRIDLRLFANLVGEARVISVEDTYQRDKVLRAWDELAALGPAAMWQVSSVVYDSNHIDPVLQLSDGAVGLTGSSGPTVFNLVFDLDTGRLGNWYLGLRNLPGRSELVMGRVEVPEWIGLGSIRGSTLLPYSDTRALTGLRWQGRVPGWFRLDWRVAIGQAGPTWGGRDQNTDVQVALRAEPWSADGQALMLQVTGQYLNPSGRGHQPSSEVYVPGASLGILRPIAPVVDAERVLAVVASGSLLLREVGIGGGMSMADNAVSDRPADPLAAILAAPSGSLTADYTVVHDSTFTGAYAYLGWTLTGEAQRHGGGIAPVRAPFSWERDTWGAWELGLRFATTNMMENIRDTIAVPLSFTAPAFQEQARKDAANRAEGGRAEEYAIGGNWYLNNTTRFGFSLVRFNWRYDHEVVNEPAVVARSYNMPAGLLSDQQRVLLGMQRFIVNDYSAEGLWIWAQTRF
jgi:hypothetical protein